MDACCTVPADGATGECEQAKIIDNNPAAEPNHPGGEDASFLVWNACFEDVYQEIEGADNTQIGGYGFLNRLSITEANYPILDTRL